jgi:EAL and modified HD-GYP domain-containing signal transduction protein
VDLFVARQPILDSDQGIYGYELLHRSSAVNAYSGADPTLASLEVINNSLFSIDIAQVVRGTRAFINFNRDLLLSDAAHVLSPNSVVVELLETIDIDAEVLAVCRKLQERGYLLAADDIVRANRLKPLLELVDFIKVDFRAATAYDKEQIVKQYGSRHTCLAEKVETQAEFETAREMGYKLFQGYFFARPVVLKSKQIPGYKMNYFRIMNAVHRRDLEFDELEGLIRQEVSVAYKLLHYANSALFEQRTHIDSIKRALVILGEEELRKWTSIVLLMHMAQDKPDALVMCALVRAAFCEALAPLSGAGGRKSELFLMGMFSLLDTMTGFPLEEALHPIYLAPDVRATLLNKQPACFPLGDIYQLMKAYEQGDWNQAVDNARHLRVETDELRDAYLRAVKWSDEVFSLLPPFHAANSPLGEHAKPSPVPVHTH